MNLLLVGFGLIPCSFTHTHALLMLQYQHPIPHNTTRCKALQCRANEQMTQNGRMCSAQISRRETTVLFYKTNQIKCLKQKTQHEEFIASSKRCLQARWLKITALTQYVVLDDQPLLVINIDGFWSNEDNYVLYFQLCRSAFPKWNKAPLFSPENLREPGCFI